MTSTATPSALCVTIQGKGQNYTHVVDDGESVLIGSDAHCRIRIPDPAVPERQCLLQFMQGEICIHDWAPEHPTNVNGQPSDPSVPVKISDRVSFGEFTFTFTTGEPVADGEDAGAATEDEPAEEPLAGRAEEAPSTVEELLSRTRESSPLSRPSEAVVPEDHRVEAEAAPEPDASATFQSDGWGAFDEPSFQEADQFAIPEDASVQETTIALLTSEIESLQAELTEKNELLAQGGETSVPSHVEDDVTEIEQRIEQLVVELEQGDQRVAAVEESLRLSEETRQAELEEKRQLEQWVGDIEERVAARELEIRAECDVLRRKLEEATKDRQEAQGQVSSLIGESEGDAVLQDMVQVLRRENGSLKTKHSEAMDQVAHLRKQVTELENAATEESIQKRINEALRVERLALAQERAALSRQQLEVTSKANELSQQLEKKSGLNPADERFRVFREQLKELHQQEQQEYVPPTITQRLVNIWQRLDGPTDTD